MVLLFGHSLVIALTNTKLEKHIHVAGYFCGCNFLRFSPQKGHENFRCFFFISADFKRPLILKYIKTNIPDKGRAQNKIRSAKMFIFTLSRRAK